MNEEKAKYPGNCYLCSGAIYVGDEIRRWQAAGTPVAAHSICVENKMAGGQSIPAPEPPPAEPPTKVKMGFLVRIEMHTKDAETAIISPEALRFQIGNMMDSWGIQEEVDYTLEVSRTYENE